MAKIFSIKCPECGAPIEIDNKRPIKFCPYCGSSVVFDDGSETVNVNYNYNIHNETYIHDTARIKEVELKGNKQKERAALRKNRQGIIAKAFVSCVLILAATFVLLFILLAIIYNVF